MTKYGDILVSNEEYGKDYSDGYRDGYLNAVHDVLDGLGRVKDNPNYVKISYRNGRWDDVIALQYDE